MHTLNPLACFVFRRIQDGIPTDALTHSPKIQLPGFGPDNLSVMPTTLTSPETARG